MSIPALTRTGRRVLEQLAERDRELLAVDQRALGRLERAGLIDYRTEVLPPRRPGGPPRRRDLVVITDAGRAELEARP